MIRLNGVSGIYGRDTYALVMNRWTATLVVALVAGAVVAGAVGAAPVGTVVAQDAPNESDGGNETDAANGTTDISPGEQLIGVVGVQGAEVEGEVESRAFDVALRRADNETERARVVAERLNRTEERLAELRERQRELRERRDAGELSKGEYAARTATTTAQVESVARGLNQSADAAAELPEAARGERGIDDERLSELRERADELRGPEVAAIARGVAGNGVGGPMAPDRRGPPGNDSDRGPPDGDAERGPPENGTERGPPENDTERGSADGAPNATDGETPGAPDGDAPGSGGNASDEAAGDGSGTDRADGSGADDRSGGEGGPSENGSAGPTDPGESSDAPSGNAGSGSMSGPVDVAEAVVRFVTGRYA
ncbi:hypothetical protein GCM10008994_31730 [Halorubrum ejinorense]|uniref:Uncharacterized protein n=2 Tax=Halorubrum ejinorense TaxID=425309 RepID=A0AAV3SWL5_9EURY